jgi:hypothetical protein
MKAANLALVALAGFGLVSSQIAYADTLPGSALPTVSHVHPVKVARLTEKRSQAGSADSGIVGAIPLGAVVIGTLAIGGLVYSLVEVNKSPAIYVSTGT